MSFKYTYPLCVRVVTKFMWWYRADIKLQMRSKKKEKACKKQEKAVTGNKEKAVGRKSSLLKIWEKVFTS